MSPALQVDSLPAELPSKPIFLDQCIMICIHCYDIIQSASTALKNPRCSACSSLPSPVPGNHGSFYCLHSFAFFPECHRVGIIQYEAFSDSLLSPSHMHVRFLHVFSWFDSSFLSRDG